MLMLLFLFNSTLHFSQYKHNSAVTAARDDGSENDSGGSIAEAMAVA